ncbi:MAG: hypothetical protein CM15mP125_0900 [Gammaproteobacteria bacterium]|nr:MAG: hypothetical protein CM15mP125_0900 [Gammaproteobacteria bacterium]
MIRNILPSLAQARGGWGYSTRDKVVATASTLLHFLTHDYGSSRYGLEIRYQ